MINMKIYDKTKKNWNCYECEESVLIFLIDISEN